MSLKPVEIGILVLSPKSSPNEWVGDEQKIAHRLVKRGLLSQDLVNPSVFSCTDEGERLLSNMVSPHFAGETFS